MFLFNILKVGLFILGSVLWLGCQSPKAENQVATSRVESTTAITTGSPQKGEQVPNRLVCMVNDMYMGKEQLAVPFEGKTYYGCCAMCQERIPKDKSVRYAIDPFSMKSISKADAYIVLIGNEGEVAYFENESHYRDFLKMNSPT